MWWRRSHTATNSTSQMKFYIFRDFLSEQKCVVSNIYIYISVMKPRSQLLRYLNKHLQEDKLLHLLALFNCRVRDMLIQQCCKVSKRSLWKIPAKLLARLHPFLKTNNPPQIICFPLTGNWSNPRRRQFTIQRQVLFLNIFYILYLATT